MQRPLRTVAVKAGRQAIAERRESGLDGHEHGGRLADKEGVKPLDKGEPVRIDVCGSLLLLLRRVEFGRGKSRKAGRRDLSPPGQALP